MNLKKSTIMFVAGFIGGLIGIAGYNFFTKGIFIKDVGDIIFPIGLGIIAVVSTILSEREQKKKKKKQ